METSKIRVVNTHFSKKLERFIKSTIDHHTMGGLVLFTGPAGSGKIESLYTILAEAGRKKKEVFSLEKRVRRAIYLTHQMQCNQFLGTSRQEWARHIPKLDAEILLISDNQIIPEYLDLAWRGILVFLCFDSTSVGLALEEILQPTTMSMLKCMLLGIIFQYKVNGRITADLISSRDENNHFILT